MQRLKNRILQDLKYNLKPSARKYGISDAVFTQALDVLVDEGKIQYSSIGKQVSLFIEAPKIIRLVEESI